MHGNAHPSVSGRKTRPVDVANPIRPSRDAVTRCHSDSLTSHPHPLSGVNSAGSLAGDADGAGLGDEYDHHQSANNEQREIATHIAHPFRGIADPAHHLRCRGHGCAR